MDENTTAVIEVTGLSRSYAGRSGRGKANLFEAVRGVDLQVHRGELFALLGTNGAGKTSLMEVLEGLARPSRGRVRVLGHDPYTERGAVRPRTGVVLQEGGFPADLTVGEMAATWAATLTRPRAPHDVLAAVGLGHRTDVALASLSGGERRRLDLALAIMGNPEILFLDEPTTGLDPESRRSAWDLVRDLVAGGTTVVLTTHYLEEAEQLADRLAIMHDGRIVREGTPAELVAAEPARIEFTVDRSAEEVPGLVGQVTARRTRAGIHYAVATADLQDDLHTLLTWARASGARLGALDARSATLEQLFLAVAKSSTDPTEPAAPAISEEAAA